MKAMARVLVALVVLALAAPAGAQPYDDPETEAALCALDPECAQKQAPPPPPDEGDATAPQPPPPPPPKPARRASGLALREGRLLATLTLEASLSKGSAFEPTSLAPDLSYGVADGVTVSLVHSGFGTTGFRGSAGGGVCVTGSDGGCNEVYNNAGVEALVDVVRGNAAAAVVGGVYALSFDPTFVDLKLGVHSMVRAGRVTATFFPSVLVGVTERDAGNKGGIFLPVSVGAQVADPLFLAVGGGWAAPLGAVGDQWTARLGVIARVRVARQAFVAASVFLPRLAGGDAVTATGADTRTLNFWITFSR